MTGEPVHLHVMGVALCGTTDVHEIMSVDHWLEHAMDAPCCVQIRERMCPKCLVKLSILGMNE